MKKTVKSTLPGRYHSVGPGGLGAAEFAKWYRAQTVAQWKALDLKAVAKVAAALEGARRDGRTVFVMGNGGSAATASHIATDLCKTAAVAGRPQLACISLADNVPFITAIGNDLSFDDIFSRQLENLLGPKDVVMLVSGSGNSPNLLRAAEYANSKGALTVGLLGFDGGKLKGLVKVAVLVESDQYGVIEDLHMSIGHILTFFLKQRR